MVAAAFTRRFLALYLLTSLYTGFCDIPDDTTIGLTRVATSPADVMTPVTDSDSLVSTAPPEEALTGWPEGPSSAFLEFEVSLLIEKYGGGLLVGLGVLGNVASIAVLRRRRLRHLPSSLYLMTLAWSDLLFTVLGQGGRHWARALTGVDPLVVHTWYCKIWYLLVPSLSMYSDWILTGVSVERCIAICLPLRAKRIVSSARSKIYLLITLLLISAYYTYGLKFYEVVSTDRGVECLLDASRSPFFAQHFRPWFEFAMSTMAPATMIMVCNCLIIRALWRGARDIALTGVEAPATQVQAKKKSSQLTSMIGMFLTVTFAFVLLTTPFRVAFVMNAVFSSGYWQSASRLAAQSRLLWAVSIFCRYLNHAINFFLYFVSGGEFRRELADMLRGLSKKQGDSASSPTNTGTGATNSAALYELPYIGT